MSDGAIDRVQIGNLSANGNSPAQYGLRVNDAAGNPLFDSLGMIKAMSLLATSGGVYPSGLPWVGSNTEIAAFDTAFTLSRQTSILVTFTGSWFGNEGTAQFIATQIGVVGWGLSGSAETSASGTMNASNLFYVVLPAGSYTASVWYGMQSGSATTLCKAIGHQEPRFVPASSTSPLTTQAR